MKLTVVSSLVSAAVLAATISLASYSVSQAQDAKATVEKRIADMKKQGGAMGALTKMAKGEEPYDKAKAVAAAETLKATVATIGAGFPAGSLTPESRAKPDIWTNSAGWAAQLKLINDAVPGLVAAANTGEQAKLAPALGEVGKVCGSCHEGFRGPPKS